MKPNPHQSPQIKDQETDGLATLVDKEAPPLLGDALDGLPPEPESQEIQRLM